MQPMPDTPVQFVSVEDRRYAYRRAGEGPAILLLHGMGETSRLFWDPLFLHLSDRYTLIAFDLPGFGDSDPPRKGYAPANEAHALASIIAQLGLEKPIMLGHSLGGILATKYAILYPDGLSHLIIYSTPLPGLPWQNLEIARRMPIGGVAMLGMVSVPLLGHLLHQNRSVPLVRMLVDAMRMTVVPSDYTDEMVAEGMRNSYDAVVQWMQQGFLLENVVKDLNHIRVPTLMMRGDQDVVPTQWAEQTCKAIAGAKMVVIKSAGHVALIEQPEQCIAAVSKFLAEPQEQVHG